jgi:mono/diheme cytochrome c family protein
MFRTRSLMAVVTLIGLAGFVACGGGEASEQQGSSGDAASSEMAKPATTDEGGAAMQQGEQALPEGVTPEMVAQGKEVFAGAGLCYVCHGGDATGMPGLGANLTDDEWIHNDGSYEGIVQTIMNGVDASQSTTGTAMPPKGGSGISDEQVKEVAAYVYSLSKHGK